MDNEVNQSAQAEKKGFSIASMVLGIVSLVCFCYCYISIPSSILAIIFGILGKKKGGKGMAIAGLVLGIIAIALFIILILVPIITSAAIIDTVNTVNSLS